MSERARRLAVEFDRAFGEPLQALAVRGANALSIRVGDAPYMLRLGDIASVGRTPKIMPLPNPSALQLGIAGLRGNLVTVFSLAALLGLPGDHSKLEWIAALARHRGMAIAFDAMDGQLELALGEQPPNVLDVTALLERGGVAL